MFTYRQAHKRIDTAARVAAVADCMRAELERARAHYEAVAAGVEVGAFGMTPEHAAQILAAWDSPRDQVTDPEPAPVRPAYMPAGAPRPMSVRDTVRTLCALGRRVPLALQLLALMLTPPAGPVDQRPRRAEAFPLRRFARELYVAAGVGPCWHDVYPRREVVSLSPP